jgi:hypothetical protein
MNPIHTLIPCFLMIHFNIILPSPPVFLVVSSFNVSYQNFGCTFHPCHACYSPYPSHLFGNSNNIWRGVQIMKLLIMQFSPSLCHFFSLRPDTHLSTLFSNILSICSSFNARDQVSHPYRTTGKIILLYILPLVRYSKLRADKLQTKLEFSSTKFYDYPFSVFRGI